MIGRMKKLALVAAAAVVAALAAVTGPLARTRADSPSTTIVVKVSITEAGAKLNRTTVSRGFDISFRITNGGKRAHTFTIFGTTSPAIPPGKQAKLNMTFARTGLYKYAVNVRKRGSGYLRVTSPV
jgi:plastocyanin